MTHDSQPPAEIATADSQQLAEGATDDSQPLADGAEGARRRKSELADDAAMQTDDQEDEGDFLDVLANRFGSLPPGLTQFDLDNSLHGPVSDLMHALTRISAALRMCRADLPGPCAGT